jgi:hypothetical protein
MGHIRMNIIFYAVAFLEDIYRYSFFSKLSVKIHLIKI